MLGGALSGNGSEGGVGSVNGGGRPRPMRPVSAMSASGVAASGAGDAGASGAGVAVASPFGEACLGALGGLDELDELAAPHRPAIMAEVRFLYAGYNAQSAGGKQTYNSHEVVRETAEV